MPSCAVGASKPNEQQDALKFDTLLINWSTAGLGCNVQVMEANPWLNKFHQHVRGNEQDSIRQLRSHRGRIGFSYRHLKPPCSHRKLNARSRILIMHVTLCYKRAGSKVVVKLLAIASTFQGNKLEDRSAVKLHPHTSTQH
jgi:hypothetical protein